MEWESQRDGIVAQEPQTDSAAERARTIATVLATVRHLAIHPAVWTFVFLLVLWRLHSAFAPHIDSVELNAAGQLEVRGYGFGRAKGESRLAFGGARNQVPLEIVDWRDHRVIATLGTPTSGSVTITRDLWSLPLPDSVLVRPPLYDLPSQPFGYQVPVQPAAAWPLFRRDHRNSGHSPFPAVYTGGAPWTFPTGNTVASTPIIDEDGIAYFGSGDGAFRAIGPDGNQLWRYSVGGRVDAAGALLRELTFGEPPSVVVPSSNGRLYRLGAGAQGPSTLAGFEAPILPESDDGTFEGSVAIGEDGTIYAGNNDLKYYALTPNGAPKWTHRTDGIARSTAAIATDGTLLWGGIDGFIRAVNVDGSTKWMKGTQGIVAASVVLGNDGTAYVGSFDSHLYALDVNTGSVRWTFKTDDHIAATVALNEDADGVTTAIYAASTDGNLYALGPKGGLLWKYETGEPIRSSPAVGLGPKGESPGIVYFGGADGKLYAIDAASGQRRWSIDTTPDDVELRDRNDISSSVALGPTAILFGTESGALWSVPYDYCLNHDDPRCSVAPGNDLPRDHFGLAYVSPGGSAYVDSAPPISPASVITLRFVNRVRGKNVGGRLCHTRVLCRPDEIRIETEPAFPFRSQVSGDGLYLHIVPSEMLRPDTEYNIRVEAEYYTGGFQLGNLTLGGTAAGTVIQKLTLRTEASRDQFPLNVGADEVSAFELTRVTATIPSTLSSLHQAGIDASSWIFSVIHQRPPSAARPGRVVLWGIGARRDADGVLVPDPNPRRTLALSGYHQGDSFVLGTENLVWTAGAATIPLQHFELRGQLGGDLRVRPGASFVAQASPSEIPGFGSQLVLGGVLNDVYDNLLLTGSYLTRPYTEGTANRRPDGVRVSMVERARPLEKMPGKVVADLSQLSSARYRIYEHRIGIVLIDRVSDDIVPINYRDNIYVVANANGEAVQVILTVPQGTKLSHNVEIVVLVDAFPVHREDLGWNLAVK